MAYRAISFAILLFSLPIAGCGTVVNLAKAPPEGGKSPFGGVRQDVYCIKNAPTGGSGCGSQPTPEPYRQLARKLGGAVDLPFSFVGDVVTWPYTASYTFINQPVPVPPVAEALGPPMTQATGNDRPPTAPLETLPQPRTLP